jgi:hypothetical protein
MKPQQQNTDIKGNSHVYVQTPDGEGINIPARDPKELEGQKDEEMAQTAGNTPTTHSHEGDKWRRCMDVSKINMQLEPGSGSIANRRETANKRIYKQRL